MGLGNGHKKSKRYEEFVIQERRWLRDDAGLCERATQRVLIYSNNFLHKKLKTENVNVVVLIAVTAFLISSLKLTEKMQHYASEWCTSGAYCFRSVNLPVCVHLSADFILAYILLFVKGTVFSI